MKPDHIGIIFSSFDPGVKLLDHVACICILVIIPLLWRDTIITVVLKKKAFCKQVLTIAEVHYPHGSEHGNMQADRELDKELRALHLKVQTAQKEWNWVWLRLLKSQSPTPVTQVSNKSNVKSPHNESQQC